jgi:N-acetyl-alpha-D-muramate 1-phosphate uridylyltransferase
MMNYASSHTSPSQPLDGIRAMIFAAGLGTRLRPFTDHHPKALAVVNGKPLLQRNIEYLRQAGIRDIMVNVHHFADQIEDFIRGHEGFGCDIRISHEPDAPLETGGGLMKAAWYFEEQSRPFVVMNADILTNLDLPSFYRAHEERKPLATLAVTGRPSSRCLLFDNHMQLTGWRNNKTGEEKIAIISETEPQALAFSAFHVIDPGMLKMVRQTGRFSIIDTYLDLARDNRILGFRHDGDLLIDVGKPESIAEAERFFP